MSLRNKSDEKGMNQKLRINWILSRPSLSGGVKSNRLIAEAMVRRGHQVTIVYLDTKYPWPHLWQIRQWLRLIIEKVRLVGRQKHHLMSSTAKLISVNDDLIKHEHVPDADISIAGFWPTREWIKDWPETKGLKGYFIRGYELHAGDPKRVKTTYRMPGLQFVISTWLQEVMAVKYGNAKAILIPNGVDWSQFDSSPRKRNHPPVVGMLYGTQELKGASTAFQAIQLVRKHMPEVKIVAFGSQPIRKKHCPPVDIKFFLRPPQDMIPEIYRSTDCWIVPSTSEGFGMPGIEAAACRCPLVSTKCGGPEDYVDEDINGFLVPVGDSQAMAEAILRVLSLKEEKWRDMSEASYQIARRFDWDYSAELLESAILNALT